MINLNCNYIDINLSQLLHNIDSSLFDYLEEFIMNDPKVVIDLPTLDEIEITISSSVKLQKGMITEEEWCYTGEDSIKHLNDKFNLNFQLIEYNEVCAFIKCATPSKLISNRFEF